jgi:hypothetical protein
MDGNYRSFWLGPIIAGGGNAYCGLGCGSECDRTTELGIHVWAGTGRLMLCCRACAEQYSALARYVWHSPRPIGVDDLLRSTTRQAAKYTLVDAAVLEEPVEAEEVKVEEIAPELVEWVPVSEVMAK